jgi:superoxide reductase
MSLGDMLQTADWKTEKHVPVIECPDRADFAKNVKELRWELGLPDDTLRFEPSCLLEAKLNCESSD